MKFPQQFDQYVIVLSKCIGNDKIPAEKREEVMDRIEGLLDWAEREGRPAGEIEYQSWTPA